MRYNPAMDGVRAVAVLLVMLFHARAPYFEGGYLGVDVFFVLSGFLITSLLLAEHDRTGSIHVGYFYLRRLLRLTPALLLLVVAYVLVAPLLWPESPHALHALVAALYLADYGVAFWGVPEQLSHTWSLAVEQHFYLLWPLFLGSLLRPMRPTALARTLAWAYLAAVLWRWLWVSQGHTWDQVYYRFDTHATGLVLGAWLAAILRNPHSAARLNRWRLQLWLPVGGLFMLDLSWGQMGMLRWGISAAEWATVLILLAVHPGKGWLYGVLAIPTLAWLGRISYGVYLWHYPIFRYLRDGADWVTVMLVGGALTVTLAAFSFYTVELRVQRLRRLILRHED